MADRHMEKLCELGKRVNIDLVVGMTVLTGIKKAQHLAFRKLARKPPYDGLKLSCWYTVRNNPVHAKTYCWLADDDPVVAFMGSANYTLAGFGKSQVEAVDTTTGYVADSLFAKIKQNSISCLEEGVVDMVNIKDTVQTVFDPDGAEQKTVTLSLLMKNGETPPRSGINWGQRANRDPDQAYINIPKSIGDGNFFPARREQFTVMTDDGESFIMIRAQDGGKGMHTTQNNALLGRYLRARMNLPSGEFVTRQHLIEYGRTDVTFTKLDDETYRMDFRPDLDLAADVETGSE